MTSEAEKSTMETCELENRYRDFSRLMTTKASEGQTTGEATGHSTKATSGTTGGNGNLSDQNFPVKLHFLLAELESVGLSHIASWQPHGRSFKVHKQNEFVNLLLRR